MLFRSGDSVRTSVTYDCSRFIEVARHAEGGPGKHVAVVDALAVAMAAIVANVAEGIDGVKIWRRCYRNGNVSFLLRWISCVAPWWRRRD